VRAGLLLKRDCVVWSNKLVKSKGKWSRYMPGVAQSVGRGIALLFHDRGTRRGWVVSSTPRPHFTPGKEPIHIIQEAGWPSGPVWTAGKSRPHWDSIPDSPARSQSLHQLSYRAHNKLVSKPEINKNETVMSCDVLSFQNLPREMNWK